MGLTLSLLPPSACQSANQATGEEATCETIVWRQPTEPLQEVVLHLPEGGHVEYRGGDDFSHPQPVPHLRRIRPNGDTQWDARPSPASAHEEGTADFSGAFASHHPPPDPTSLPWFDASLAADAARLYVVSYSRYATGADVIALDIHTGEWLWGRAVRGLGEVAHSRYRNAVRAEVVDGALVVFGDESAGHYIEAWSADGTWLFTRRRPQNLAR